MKGEGCGLRGGGCDAALSSRWGASADRVRNGGVMTVLRTAHCVRPQGCVPPGVPQEAGGGEAGGAAGGPGGREVPFPGAYLRYLYSSTVLLSPSYRRAIHPQPGASRAARSTGRVGRLLQAPSRSCAAGWLRLSAAPLSSIAARFVPSARRRPLPHATLQLAPVSHSQTNDLLPCRQGVKLSDKERRELEYKEQVYRLAVERKKQLGA